MKINIPKGTRDFSEKQLLLRNKIIKIIKTNFELFGFSPIETPSFEMLSIYDKINDNESNKLIFKVKTYRNNDIIKKDKKQVLRYDLTLPMIRYYMMHKSSIFLPFKRYQIQPVWRAEKPQKGRLREFYQCDADIISSHYSLWDEIELIKLYDIIFLQLDIPITIDINHRLILYGLSEIFGIKNFFKDFVIILDKLDKIGIDKFKYEIKNIINKSIDLSRLLDIINFKGSFEEKIKFYKKNIFLSEYGKKGIEDILFIYNKYKIISENNSLNFNISLARGLNYYTGTIFEIKSKLNNIKYSLGGGGRYDKILKRFGIKKNILCVGISLGLDRIYIVMEKLGLINDKFNPITTKIMFINFGDKESLYSYKFIKKLRLKSIPVELYPYSLKIKKQIQYANKKGIKFIAIIGNNEIEKKIINIKDLENKTSKNYKNIDDIIKILH